MTASDDRPTARLAPGAADAFASFLDASPVAMAVVDDEGLIRRCNAAMKRLLGEFDGNTPIGRMVHPNVAVASSEDHEPPKARRSKTVWF